MTKSWVFMWLSLLTFGCDAGGTGPGEEPAPLTCGPAECGGGGACVDTGEGPTCSCDAEHTAAGLFCVPDEFTPYGGATDHVRLLGTIRGEDVDFETGLATNWLLIRCEVVYLDPDGPSTGVEPTLLQVVIKLKRPESSSIFAAADDTVKFEVHNHDFVAHSIPSQVDIDFFDDQDPPAVGDKPELGSKKIFRVKLVGSTIAEADANLFAAGGMYTLESYTPPDLLAPGQQSGPVGGRFFAGFSATDYLEGSFYLAQGCLLDQIKTQGEY